MTLFASLAGKFKALTARERAALAILAAALSGFICAGAIEWAQSQARAAHLAEQRLAALTGLHGALEDVAYRQELAHEVARAWRWSFVDDALAGESVRSEIEGFCQGAGMAGARVRLEEAPARRGAVGLVRVEVEASFDWQSFLALLSALEVSDKSYAVSAIALRQQEAGPELSIIIEAPTLAGSARNES
ncbi:hypothetical protein [Candidatus Viadribacter manganicus]|uniref:Uncharacterized protein n=1 Tax=Candidatus Viadribacter manganicus TaxID=1759059 RepID=A0A1B1AGP2_9PROT|nr:hypothetical protein [Candidatus Viadribacter manganicus]ANP45715.1 hypothetical protein ATE48_07180 [Candidatus Viadribacter manganicus]